MKCLSIPFKKIVGEKMATAIFYAWRSSFSGHMRCLRNSPFFLKLKVCQGESIYPRTPCWRLCFAVYVPMSSKSFEFYKRNRYWKWLAHLVISKVQQNAYCSDCSLVVSAFSIFVHFSALRILKHRFVHIVVSMAR